MTPDDYKQMIQKLRHRLIDIDLERAEMDARRSDLDREAASLKATMADLLPLSGEVSNPNDLSGLGFTSAIRKVLAQKRGTWMTATEVREALVEKGFELSTYTNPMASIYKILSRVSVMDGFEGKSDGTTALYRAKGSIKNVAAAITQ